MKKFVSRFKDELNFLYPKSLMDDFPSFPPRSVLPCSAILENEEIGGLFLTMPEEDMDHYGLFPNASPEPLFRFRMLNFARKYYVIEIWIMFYKDKEKILKIHLNPENRQVQQFLHLVSENRMISVHFYGVDSKLVGTVLVSLHIDHKKWVDRNYALSKKLFPKKMSFNQEMFPHFSSQLAKDMKPSDRLYTPQDTDKQSYFVGESEELESYSK